MHLLEDVRFGIKYGVIVSALLKTLASYCTEVVHMTSFFASGSINFYSKCFFVCLQGLKTIFYCTRFLQCLKELRRCSKPDIS